MTTSGLRRSSRVDFKNASPLFIDLVIVGVSLLATICAIPMAIMIGVLAYDLILAILIGAIVFLGSWIGFFILFLCSLKFIIEKYF